MGEKNDDVELLSLDIENMTEDTWVHRASVSHSFNQVPLIEIQFRAEKSFDFSKVIGSTISLKLAIGEKNKRGVRFNGRCIAIECLKALNKTALFHMTVRPWLYFLSKTSNCRVFQEMTAPEVIKEVISDHPGLWSHVEQKLRGTYDKRPYCVQYNETDLNFISRLMEEEGISYYFDFEEKKETMVIVDNQNIHKQMKGNPFVFLPANSSRAANNFIYDWNPSRNLVAGKISFSDYDFEKPKLDQVRSLGTTPEGKHKLKNVEHFSYPGPHRTSRPGDHFIRAYMEEEASTHQRWYGSCGVRDFHVGKIFKVKDSPLKKADEESLLISAKYFMQSLSDKIEDNWGQNTKERHSMSDMPLEENQLYVCYFEAIPKSLPYRPPRITPKPTIPGIQTAVVTGPAGDEIHTDKHGRIKVHFHWDRKGKKDDHSSCWVRAAMPWTGKNWGMIALPRIGQEVVIQFEDGDPDRPLCTMMLYNADTMPPFPLPDNMTQSGIKTNTTKGGEGFNELVFEDKKNAEFVRLQSEKDYIAIIKNNATITIGAEKKDKGDLVQTIHGSKTELLKEGNDSLKVEKGTQTIFIKSDRTDEVQGKMEQKITKDLLQSILQGNYTQEVNAGNVKRTVAKGNEEVSLPTGNYKLALGSGTITLQAGASSIKISPQSVEIKSPMIKLEATMLLQGKSGAFTKFESSAMHIVKAATILLN